jgi:nucleotide-binding universal stress UspA family protein
MKKILIALDYDPSAQLVAETGFSLAENLHAGVTLLHVISDPAHYDATKHITIMGFAGFRDALPQKLDSVGDRTLFAQEFLDKSKEYLGAASIQTIVVEGDFAESILKTANELHADIIVMGSHSRKWQQNIVIGSVSEKVLHYTSVPVFIIPTKNKK